MKAAAAVPARYVLLLPSAACLRHLSLLDFEPLAGFVPLGDFGPLVDFAVLVDSVALAAFVKTDGPGSIGVAAQYSVALCSAAL